MRAGGGAAAAAAAAAQQQWQRVAGYLRVATHPQAGWQAFPSARQAGKEVGLTEGGIEPRLTLCSF